MRATQPVYIEAEYEDGFVHVEDEQDRSLYELGRNVYFDIVNGLPEVEHGSLQRFSLVNHYDELRHDIDFHKTPPGAKPYREKFMSAKFFVGEDKPAEVKTDKIVFGWVLPGEGNAILDSELVEIRF